MTVAYTRTRATSGHPSRQKIATPMTGVRGIAAIEHRRGNRRAGPGRRMLGLRGPGREDFYEATSRPKPNIAGFPELDIPADAVCGYLSVLEDRAMGGAASASS